MHQGELVAGRFEVQHLAGQGGMGKVYRAHDRATGADVALKVLHDVDGGARFEREGEVLAGLVHPGIVRHVAHGRTPGGDPYLAMEWLEGESLSARLERSALSLDDTLTLGACVAEALGEAHRVGIVHRDVKPHNLVLAGGEPARVKLVDFGIAKIAATTRTLTATGGIVGTPGYMAPEQAWGKPDIDARTDVYALGVVLFRCLSGQMPFTGDGSLALLLKAALEDAPRMREIAPALPEALDDLVARMVARSPAARPAHGHAVAAELRLVAALGGAPSGAGPAAPATTASTAPGRAISATEQRLLCVIMIRARAGAAGGTGASPPGEDLLPRLTELAEGHGGRLRVVADGSLFVTVSAGPETPAEMAVRAARCALAMKAATPEHAVAMVAARAVPDRWVPMGEAIDRGVALLGFDVGGDPRAPAVRVDPVLAVLLEPRYALGEDAGGRFLSGEDEVAAGARRLLGKPTPCVGRGPELRHVGMLVEESFGEPAARAVLVTAPPGIGKSRFGQELVREAVRRWPDAEVWTGRGDPMSAGSAFALVSSALRGASGVQSGEPPSTRRGKLEAWAAQRLATPAIGPLAGALDELAVPGDAAGDDARLRGERMRRAWVTLVRAVVSTGPLILVLEDLHWGDLPSISLVGAALRELAERPLMVLGLARPEVHEVFPRAGADLFSVEVKLGPLSRRAGRDLARGVLGTEVSEETIAAVVARSAGNAFYLEELIRAVAEGKHGELPETVLGMVEARLQRLDPEARRALRAASVFGETFWEGGVRALVDAEAAAAVPALLASLAEGEAIEEPSASRFPGEREYAFRHALLREGAYAMLTPEDRQAGHRLAAAWLERAGESDGVVLGEHLERGGEPARAAAWFVQAARQAMAGGDLAAAEVRARRALAHDESGARPVLGEVAAWGNAWAAAEAHVDEIFDGLSPGSAGWAEVATGKIMMSLFVGKLDPLLEPGGAALTALPAPGAEGSYVFLQAIAMTALSEFGRRGPVERCRERMERLASPLAAGSPLVRGWVESGLAVDATASREPWRALGHSRRAAEVFEAAGDTRYQHLALANVARCLHDLGDLDGAEGLLRSMLEGNASPYVTGSVRFVLSWVRLDRGDLAEARAIAGDLVAAARPGGNLLLGAAARWVLGDALTRLGDLAAAEHHLRAALDAGVLVPSYAVPCRATLARLRLRQGRVAEAFDLASAALVEMASLETRVLRDGEVRLIHVEALLASGDLAAARRALASAGSVLGAAWAQIGDPVLARSFLEGVPAHARLLALARDHA